MVKIIIRKKEIEEMFDNLIKNPYLILDDGEKSRKLGYYGRELRHRNVGILHLSTDELLGENIAFLKNRKKVKKRKTRRGTIFIFD